MVKMATRRPPLANGSELIERWKIPARQARFRRDGLWYGPFARFPVACCDCTGYILFETEDDLRRYIKPSGQVWVPHGISAIAGYRRVKDPIEDPYNPVIDL
jgi:hypothetical protein